MNNARIVADMLDLGRMREAQAWLDGVRAQLAPDEVATLQTMIWAAGDVPRRRGDKHAAGDGFASVADEMHIAAAVTKAIIDNGNKRGATKAAIANFARTPSEFKEIERLYYKWRDHL